MLAPRVDIISRPCATFSRVSDTEVHTRLHAGDGGTYLWVLNPTRTPKAVSINLDSGRAGAFRSGRELWQSGTPVVQISGSQVRVTVQDRNAAVVKLEA